MFKIGEKDENYFNKAEKLLYNELSISLGMSYDETKKILKSKKMLFFGSINIFIFFIYGIFFYKARK